MHVIETYELTKRYGGLMAVNQVSFHVEEGEIMGLIGPNGAGKTTLLNAIAGLDPPTSGSVHFLGHETTGLPPQAMCHRGLSRTFQIPQAFPKMTALENVMVATIFGNEKGRVRDVVRHSRDQLDFVEFPMSENTLSETLNAVQLKRLDLARALASSPKVVMLDELASGLTEGELDDLMAIIRKIRGRGITIFIIEHIIKFITNLCERLVVLQYGNKIAEGPTRTVVMDPKVNEAYFGREE